MLSNIKAVSLVRLVVAGVFLLLVSMLELELMSSAFVGVMSSLVPESYQAWKLSKTQKELNPEKWLSIVYRVMVTKWLMAIMVFSIVFVVSSRWDYGVLFLGYLLVQMSGLITPFLTKGLK